MGTTHYIMEHDEEALRLDLKTGSEDLNRQALWAGIRPGMRVADVGCGSGKTTEFLHKLVQPHGTIVGIDASETRIGHATAHYGKQGIEFVRKDFYQPLVDLGTFDFIWVRFVLEYHRSKSLDIVDNLSNILNPGGILCLIDLDHNCLNHYGLPPRLELAIFGIMDALEKMHDFDPFTGRKLYSFLYDLGFEDITVDMGYHHLIYGTLNNVDAYNWTRKVEVAARNSGYPFHEYEGGFGEFLEEFKRFFADPRRFTYTPLIACRGRKPLT
ncbi:MAG: methyltransferase domain-containing protein [Desulfuromonadales bacterium]|nr:methyltransferase domain-containing protein [Desulfuromonadales bacterium]